LWDTKTTTNSINAKLAFVRLDLFLSNIRQKYASYVFPEVELYECRHEDLLYDHDEDVEPTLPHPRTAGSWVTWQTQHTVNSYIIAVAELL